MWHLKQWWKQRLTIVDSEMDTPGTCQGSGGSGDPERRVRREQNAITPLSDDRNVLPNVGHFHQDLPRHGGAPEELPGAHGGGPLGEAGEWSGARGVRPLDVLLSQQWFLGACQPDVCFQGQ